METIKFNTLVKEFNAMVDLCTKYVTKTDHEIKCIISSSFETDMLILKETNATDETQAALVVALPVTPLYLEPGAEADTPTTTPFRAAGSPFAKVAEAVVT